MFFVKISQNFIKSLFKILVYLTDLSPQLMACMKVKMFFFLLKSRYLTLYSIITPFDAFEISLKMKHLLFWSKCFIFHIFKSIQNLT